ncbi:hypothetical protein [Coleofasciculus chthonoplastes]|jgi:hypothetical protein|uniref:hypothetical protein n=1 Tax=Coleofasciculus chthonoplastes TaxID=64178 RepID=UPI0033017248
MPNSLSGSKDIELVYKLRGAVRSIQAEAEMLGLDSIEQLANCWNERDLRAGTGFNFDIVHTELNKVGGAISTSSLPGKGTTFKIIDPKALG